MTRFVFILSTVSALSVLAASGCKSDAAPDGTTSPVTVSMPGFASSMDWLSRPESPFQKEVFSAQTDRAGNNSNPDDDPDDYYYVESIYWQVRNVSDGQTDGLVLLTIDDVPNEETTAGFLDVLDDFDVRALFFINGDLSEENPQLVEKILEEGHQIGNHTWHHRSLIRLDREQTIDEITRVNEWLKEKFDYKPAYFRPPYGLSTPASDSVVAAHGMMNMGWSVGTYDWVYPEDEDIEENSPKIARRTVNAMIDGGIILIHDLPVSLAALPLILEELIEEGYHFVDPGRLAN